MKKPLFDFAEFSEQVRMHEKHYNRSTGTPKKAHKTSLDAFEHAKRLGLDQYGFYECPICKKYHVGHY
jgi:hypothetical protein